MKKKGPTEVGGKVKPLSYSNHLGHLANRCFIPQPMLTAVVPLGVESNSPYFDSFNFVGKIIGPKVMFILF